MKPSKQTIYRFFFQQYLFIYFFYFYEKVTAFLRSHHYKKVRKKTDMVNNFTIENIRQVYTFDEIALICKLQRLFLEEQVNYHYLRQNEQIFL